MCAFNADISATNVGLIAYSAINENVKLFGKFGSSNWDMDVSMSGYGSGSESGRDTYYGFGFEIASMSGAHVVLEYELIKLDDVDADAKSINFGIGFTL